MKGNRLDRVLREWAEHRAAPPKEIALLEERIRARLHKPGPGKTRIAAEGRDESRQNDRPEAGRDF